MPNETTPQTKTTGQHVDSAISAVKQQYDELNVQMHLADMEVRQEWESMQDRWQKFCDDCERVGTAVEDSEAAIAESLGAVAAEFQSAFDRISRAVGS